MGDGQGQLPGVMVAEKPMRAGWSIAVWASLGLLAHAALLDAAVETFASGSPLRWWVSPAAILAAALSMWLWRPGGRLLSRFGPAAAAATAGLAFVALLAVTAWLPAGQERGMRAFLQATPRLLTLAVAAAVVLAAAALMRAARVLGPAPRRATRLIVALLAGYSVVALALGVRESSPFPLLFNGAAAWHRLPRWFQGPFLGVVLLLPVAVVSEGLRAIVQRRSRHPIGLALTQATALGMAAVMAFSGLALPATAVIGRATPAAPRAVDEATASIRTAEVRRELIGSQDWGASVRGYVAAAENELRRPGADPSDIEAKAALLSHDIGRIFQFVRDQFVLEPYVGELRGPRGTLLAGAGNSLDRALLAQALLRASGVAARLVKGRLSTAEGDALFQAYVKRRALDGPLATCAVNLDPSTLPTTARDLAAKTGLNERGVLASLRRAQAKGDIMWWKTDEARAAHLAFVQDQLRRVTPSQVPDWQDLDRELRERLREHYWLQVGGRDGSWTDFDTASPESALGKTAGSAAVVLEAVPAEAVHRFEFSLVYRTKAGGETHDEVLLKRNVAAADALFDAMDFRIQPDRANLDQLLSMDAAGKINAAREMKRFRPILRIGKQVIAGRVFDLQGHTYDSSGATPSGSVSGMMGGMLGFGEEAPPAEFADLRVVLRLSGPGRAPSQQIRTLVRSADLASPTFAPPLAEWDVLVQAGWLPAEFVSFSALKQLMAFAREGQDAAVAAPSPLPVQLLHVALARQAALAQIVGTKQGLRPLVDRPLVTISTHALKSLDADGRRIVTSRSIDIVENAVRYVASDARSQAAAFDVALQQGVADCVLEGTMLQELANAESETGEAVFRRAQVEGHPAVVTTAADLAPLRAGGMGEADLEWIRDYESPRARLVAQTSGGRSAWWSVQPDGNAVLRVSGGHGQALTEHEIIESVHDVMMLICGFEIIGSGGEDHGGGGGEGHEPAKQGGLDWKTIHKAEFVAKRVALGVCIISSGVGIAGTFVHAAAFEAFAMVLLGVDVGVTIGEKGFELGMKGVEALEDLGRPPSSGEGGHGR